MAETLTIHDGSNQIVVSLSDYLNLRNQLKENLSKFYHNITFRDAGIDGVNITFNMFKNGRMITKLFNAIEWLEYQANGILSEEYSKFIRAKVKTPWSNQIGKGNSKGWKKSKF